MRRITSVIGALVGVALAASLTGCAQPQTISVTPSTDLLNEASVTVTGSGYPPGASVVVMQCAADAVDMSDCDGTNSPTPTVDSDGKYSTPLVVRREITTLNGLVDCRNVGSCVIASGPAQGMVLIDVRTPIEFRRVPHATVQPANGLLDGHEVAITGRSFESGRDYIVWQCAVGRELTEGCTVDPLATVTPDANGDWAITAFVQSSFTDQVGGTVDCTQPVACDITIHDPASGSNLSFLHTEFAGHDFGITVSPNTDLADGQVVRVQGEDRGGGSKIMQCPIGVGDYTACDMRTLQYVGGSGTGFDVEMTLYATIQSDSGQTTDCTVPGACMVIADLNHGWSIFFPSWEPIEFD